MPDITIEEIQAFVVERLEEYINNNTYDDVEMSDVPTARGVKYKVEEYTMLDKDEAKWLENMLEEKLAIRIQQGKGRSTYTSWIDSLGIYADAWAWYCRPGTYRIPV